MNYKQQKKTSKLLPLRALKSWFDGDFFVKLTPFLWGAGYIRRRKYVIGFLALVFELAVIVFTAGFSMPNISKLDTLGTVRREVVYNSETLKNEVNNFDNSFLILLFSLVGIIVILMSIIILMKIIVEAESLQRKSDNNEKISSFSEDVRELFNKKFHITLLAVPSLGIIVFTIVPLIFMILVAFTNLDIDHMSPTELFTWVGLDNFQRLFSDSLSDTFGYSFLKILGWTLTWSVFATLTCYFGGIFLSLLINHKRTRAKKLWRTLFVICIAVPQFVSLLLVRNFFADTGIINTFLSNSGITDFLKNIGLVASHYTYVPFLTQASWAKVMIILINFWVGVPYLLLIATGVLMNIPKDYYEAARIDGASPFKRFTKITMPYMFAVTAPYLVTSFIANINNFNVIFLLTQGLYVTSDTKLAASNAKEVDLLVTWLFRLTNEFYNYKMAAVIGILVFIVCAVFTMLAFNYTFKKVGEDKFQ